MDEAPEVPLDRAAEVEADAVKDLESLVAVEVAPAETVEEVVSLMPQTASASNVNGIFLASHSEVCRSMESGNAKKLH